MKDFKKALLSLMEEIGRETNPTLWVPPSLRDVIPNKKGRSGTRMK